MKQSIVEKNIVVVMQLAMNLEVVFHCIAPQKLTMQSALSVPQRVIVSIRQGTCVVVMIVHPNLVDCMHRYAGISFRVLIYAKTRVCLDVSP